jgi:protocatechuate 3,4-dioxygenase beta subunit
MPGIRLLLTGRVVTRSCTPVTRALLDFWQADANGEYDNAGYRLRGHLFTDAQGSYRLETVVPGQYTGRTRHIHVKVQAPGRLALTTQIYFPGEQNATDSIFRPELLARVEQSATQWTARFDFVLDLP